MDEKGFLLGIALKVKVICRRGRKNPRYSQDGNREIVTVIECVSAAGEVLTPMYIYKGSAPDGLACGGESWRGSNLRLVPEGVDRSRVRASMAGTQL